MNKKSQKNKLVSKFTMKNYCELNTLSSKYCH